MNTKAYQKLKKIIKPLLAIYDIKDLVAEIYNLYQEYVIDEKQEEELYNLVDPEETESCPAELWFSDQYGCVALYEYAHGIAY